MAKPRVLYVCHNHPNVRPGGAEVYALELYEAMQASQEFSAVFLAKGGPPVSNMRRPHEGTLLGAVNSDPHQYFFYTDGFEYDWFYGTIRDKDVYTTYLRDFLLAYQPDVVHFQHTLFLGYDMIREVRNTLPNAAIVYTLHEYLPICHNNGQMIRTNTNELCSEESPRRCHECFPNITPQSFFLRKRFIQSFLSLVDVFLAPSRFLVERYVAWGIPREKIRYEPNGRLNVQAIMDGEDERPRTRFGFFGQLTHFKGVNVLLRAMQLVGERAAGSPGAVQPSWLASPFGEPPAAPPDPESEIHLWLYGANLELQPGTFQNEFRTLLETTRQQVTLVGRYTTAELPRLMASVDWVVAPSIWWENAPLVIQEAFQYGRPVICSDIGGLAEAVRHGVNGLHFRTGDPIDLADTLRTAASTPGLWELLRRGIEPVHSMDDHVTTLAGVYRTSLDRTV